MMEVDDLQPTLTHPNEYVSVQDLAEAKLFEFEQHQRWEMAVERQRQLEEQELATKGGGDDVGGEQKGHHRIEVAEVGGDLGEI